MEEALLLSRKTPAAGEQDSAHEPVGEKIARFGTTTTTQALRLKCLSTEAFWNFFKLLVFGSADPGEHPARSATAAAQTGVGRGPASRRRSAWPSAGERGLMPPWAGEGRTATNACFVDDFVRL